MNPFDSRLLDAVFASLGSGLCLLDPRSVILKTNAAWARCAKRDIQELVGKPVWEVFSQAPSELRSLLENTRRGEASLETVTHFGSWAGCELWNHFRLTPVPLDGEMGLLVSQVVGAAVDDDARDQTAAEDALRRSETSLRNAERLAELGSWEVFYHPSEQRYWSPGMYRILGRDPRLGPAAPEALQHLYPADEWALISAASRVTLADGTSLELEGHIVGRGGTPRTVVTRGEAMHDCEGRIIGMRGTIQDVTASKRSHEASRAASEALRDALADSEQRLAAAFEASPMPKLLIRIADHRIVEVNSACLELVGLTREQVIGAQTGALGVLGAEDDARFWQLVAEQSVIHEFEVGFQPRGGTPKHGLASARRLTLGAEDYVFVVAQDVTERRRAEQARLDSDARFRQLADTIDEVFWLTDLAKGQMVYVSPAYERIWGRTCASLHETPSDWASAIHPDDRQRVLEAAHSKQADGRYDEEYRVVRPDGSVRWIRDRAYPVRDERGCVIRIAGSAQDITDRRALQAQLNQTQRMESIGLLAGGVAHDFNNLLTVIAGNCYALREVLPASDASSELVGEIHDATEHAASLTRQLLAFSRKEAIEPRVVDLVTVVVDTEKMLRRLLGEDVLLTTSFRPDASRVKVDPGSFTQVLMNLAVNARDAMPRGGKLLIETRSILLDDDFVMTRPHLTPGMYVQLSISDTGTGMPLDVQEHIFEPFFTTKGSGHGTGLGLSVVHGIVAQNGGHIEVSSELGVGTTFRIYLPSVDAALSRAASKLADDGTPAVETILLVEDDDSTRRAINRALQRLGYQVLQASSGEEALALASNHAGAIDLLVTDVIMPHMDGRQLAEALRTPCAGLRVLFMSGYPDDAVLRHGVQHDQVAFLSKPYDLPTLQRKVRAVLDSV